MTAIATERVLGQLAAEINAADQSVRQAVSNAVVHAMRAGELLAEVKRRLPHGEFIAWAEQHCTFGLRTAQLYMRLARELPAKMRNGVSLLSLREAITLVREARPAGPPYAVAVKYLADRISWANPNDRARFWGLLGQLRARGDPGPTLLAALEHYAAALAIEDVCRAVPELVEHR